MDFWDGLQYSTTKSQKHQNSQKKSYTEEHRVIHRVSQRKFWTCLQRFLTPLRCVRNDTWAWQGGVMRGRLRRPLITPVLQTKVSFRHEVRNLLKRPRQAAKKVRGKK